MTHIVTEACIQCRYTDCVEACPVEGCFHVGPNMVVIHPDKCIDCRLCVSECPVNAIYSEEDLPEKYQEFKALNAKLALKWPMIHYKEPPLPDAEDWADRENKLSELIESCA